MIYKIFFLLCAACFLNSAPSMGAPNQTPAHVKKLTKPGVDPLIPEPADEKKLANIPTENYPYEFELLPIPAVFFTPETSLGYGGMLVLSYKKPRQIPSTLRFFAAHTLKNQFTANIHWDHIYPDREYRIESRLNFRVYPLKYFGLGPDSKTKDADDFTPQVFEGSVRLEKKLAQNLYADVHYIMDTFTMEEFTEGGIVRDPTLAGYDGGTTSGFGVSLSYDSREHLYLPKGGFLSQFRLRIFDGILGSDFDYLEFYLQHTHFLPLGPETILASNTLITSLTGDAQFRWMPGLGGFRFNRGYYFKRYRDRNAISQQVEIRQHLFWRIGLTAFGGIGNVGKQLDWKIFEGMKVNYGIGARLNIDEENRYTLRADLGFTPESGATPGVYVAVFEAF